MAAHFNYIFTRRQHHPTQLPGYLSWITVQLTFTCCTITCYNVPTNRSNLQYTTFLWEMCAINQTSCWVSTRTGSDMTLKVAVGSDILLFYTQYPCQKSMAILMDADRHRCILNKLDVLHFDVIKFDQHINPCRCVSGWIVESSDC